MAYDAIRLSISVLLDCTSNSRKFLGCTAHHAVVMSTLPRSASVI
jgi:hypothetical protein